jgi:hypothetical protein
MPFLSRFENLIGDEARLVLLVAHADELRLLAGGSLRPQVLGEALGRKPDHPIGGGEDGPCRAVVPVERDDLRRRIELAGEVEDVADRRRPEGIDRLGVVADDCDPAPVRLEREQDGPLHRSCGAVGRY